MISLYERSARSSMDRASDSGSECWGFESLRAYHVGASFVSLAPTYFISQSALTPLLLLSNCAPLLLGSQLVCRPAGGLLDFCQKYRLKLSFWVSLPLVAPPFGISMLGASELPLRQGFRRRRKRLYGASAPPARWPLERHFC